MDALDKAILMELSVDCRVSYTRLANKYHVSITTIKNRVQSLVERRIILGFSVQPRQELFNASTAIVLFHLSSHVPEGFITRLGLHENVSAAGVGLSGDGFAVLTYRNSQELNDAVEFLSSFDVIREFEVFPVLLPPSSS